MRERVRRNVREGEKEKGGRGRGMKEEEGSG